MNVLILAILFILFSILYYFTEINESFLPFYSSPPKRNMPYDLRCIPYIPKKNFPWNNSSYDYYYRPKCLMMG